MHKSTRALALAVSLVLLHAGAPAQNLDQYLAQVKAIQSRAEMRAAFDYIDEHRDQILHEWEEITEVNAPSGQEKKRAAYVFKLLKKLKLDELRYDSIGNLIAVRKGTGGGPRVVFDAHLDTVFQPGLEIEPKIRDGKIYAPGVGDDTRNIEALLASIRALNHARIRTKGDLVFVFTVDEERSLGGAEHFVKENKGKFDYYVVSPMAA
jgi:acetylornithine deacetylase/succinyl-diaminopimelate desuccinylase-like protein